MSALNPSAAAARALALTAALLLAACGGGSDSPAGTEPTLTADRSAYFVGEQARLTVRYEGSNGRIEPGIGPVASGTTVLTPVLSTTTTFRLTVDTPQGPVRRELALPVGFRNRYVELATPFYAYGHEAVPMPDGSVLLVSGSRGENIVSHRVTRFDPAARSLADIGLLLIGRTSHRATLLADGTLLVSGGETSFGSGAQLERFDPRSGASGEAGRMAVRRSDHSATRLADGRVLLAGGIDSVRLHDSAELWDPATGSVRLLAARMAHARASHTATLLADGRVLIAGGYAQEGAAYRTAELFDPRTEQFEPLGPVVPQTRALHAALPLADGSVVLAGGEHYDWPTDVTTVLGSAVRIAANAGAIEPAAALRAPRTASRAAALADGRLLLFGGFDSEGNVLAGSESYAPAMGGTEIAPMPQARVWHTVTRLPDGRILIAGGGDPQQDYVPQVLIYE